MINFYDNTSNSRRDVSDVNVRVKRGDIFRVQMSAAPCQRLKRRSHVIFLQFGWFIFLEKTNRNRLSREIAEEGKEGNSKGDVGGDTTASRASSRV